MAAYIEADPDYAAFFARVTDLLRLVLPRFVEEGKKYATIAIGCTGGRHRSVTLVERLASHLSETGWRVSTTHRELAREGTLARTDLRHEGESPMQAPQASEGQKAPLP